MFKTIGSKSTTNVVYINAERYQRISETAIELSYKGKKQISASQFAQYILDNFAGQAKEKLILEFVQLETDIDKGLPNIT